MFSRRAGSRFNRGLVSSVAPSASSVPGIAKGFALRLDASAASELSLTGANVDSWQGTGPAFIKNADATRPQYSATAGTLGTSGVIFSGGQFLKSDAMAALAAKSTQWTALVVGECLGPTDGTQVHHIFSLGRSDGTDNYVDYRLGTDSTTPQSGHAYLQLLAQGSGGSSVNGSTGHKFYDYAQPGINALTWQNPSIAYAGRGQMPRTVDISGLNAYDDFNVAALGARAVSTYVANDTNYVIHEFLWWPRALSLAEYQYTWDTLAAKWSLAPATQLFVIMGQSNASGRGETLPTTASVLGAAHARCHDFDNLARWNWLCRDEPLDTGQDESQVWSATDDGAFAGYSVAIDLLQTLTEQLPHHFAVMQWSKGSTDSTNWVSGAAVFEAGWAKLQMALQTPNVKLAGIIVWQGESDTSSQDEVDAWVTNWTATIAYLRANIPTNKWYLNALPFFFVELYDKGGSYWDELRTAQAAFHDPDNDIWVTESPATPLVSGSVLHIDTGTEGADGLRWLGEQLALAYTSAY